MKRRCVIDEAIGETRAAVWEGKVIAEYYLRRWTDKDTPQRGDIFAGRVRKIEKSLGAAFIDLGSDNGSDKDGFLKFTTAPDAPRLSEGMRLEVEVTREAEAEKGPMVSFIKSAPDSKPGRISGADLKDVIAQRFSGISFETAGVNGLPDAVQREIAIPGGGVITIEKTKALTAIDIDTGHAMSPFNVAVAACPLIEQQLRLRGIGGLIAIDFPNLRQRRQREDIIDALKDAFEEDPNAVKIAHLSRFGVAEMTRQRMGPSIDEILTDRVGSFTIESRALEALRRLQTEARHHAGAQLRLTVPKDVHDWLLSNVIEWRAPLTEKIGARFELAAGHDVAVSADR